MWLNIAEILLPVGLWRYNGAVYQVTETTVHKTTTFGTTKIWGENISDDMKLISTVELSGLARYLAE